MNKKLLFSIVILGALALGAALYFYVYPGKRGHEIVPVKDESEEIAYWTCTMHPSVKMKEPGTCPICGMDLVPVKKSPTSAASGAPLTVDAGMADKSVFTVDAHRRQLLNVQTTPVGVRMLQKLIRTVGMLELDETRIEYVHSKIKGWVDQVFVDATLQHVRRGQALFTIYSPELVASQEEYLVAIRTAESLSGTPFEHVAKGTRSLIQAARRRLELFDMTEAQIREIEKSGRARKTITIFSPASGHVLERSVFPNTYITPETKAYSIADHTHLWAQISIYESDISHVRSGQHVVITTTSYPGESFHGKISYPYPHVQEQTRTMKARVELPNPRLKLKPGMYVDAELKVVLGKHLSIPDSAVLRTGKRDLVFVDRGEGRMQLREVAVGAKVDNYYQILRGLALGERVVTSANFLIDAESKVQGVEATWETPKPRKADPLSR